MAKQAFGYMLEHPRIPRYQRKLVTMRRVRTISRKDQEHLESSGFKFSRYPQRLYAEHLTAVTR